MSGELSQPSPSPSSSSWRIGTRRDRSSSTSTGVVPRRSLGMMIGVVLLFAAGFVLLDLLIQNSHGARLHFLWWHSDLALSVWVLAAAFIAIVIDELIGVAWRRRRRRMLNLEEAAMRQVRSGRVPS